jgi:predicted nucleic acid-binding protein
MLTGVLDANAIIGLAKGGIFHVVASLYAPLYVPTSVKQEVAGQGRGRAGVSELTQALGLWITEVTPDPHAMQQFSFVRSIADREVLAVALQKKVDHILSDDGPLRRHANRSGLKCLQVPQVVVLMKHQALLADVKAVLDRMREHGYGIADVFYREALRAAGERLSR